MTTAEENKEFYKVATRVIPKALRGLRWGIDDDKAEEILQKVLSATKWHLLSTSTRIKSYADGAADFQHPPKGVQGKEKT